ncbi:MAG: LuxR C-terminal-related transcriptional regulator, partial [Thiohalomonadales bacterium]
CELAWPDMDRYIQSAPWLAWVKALPTELVRGRPVLLANYAWALLDIGELEAAEIELQAVEVYLDNIKDSDEKHRDKVIVDEEQFQRLPVTISAARAYLAQTRGEFPAAIKFSQQTLSLLAEEDHMHRLETSIMLGLTYFASGDIDAAYQRFSEGLAGLRKTGSSDHSIGGIFVLADIRTLQGRLRDAVNLYEQSLHWVAGKEPFPQGTAYIYLGLSKLHSEWGNTQIASQHLQRSEIINNETPLQLCRYRLALAQARICEQQGDMDEALCLLDTAEQLFYRNVVPETRSVAPLKARIWIAQNRLNEANTWIQERELSIDDELSFLCEFEHVTLLRLLIAQYRKNKRDKTITEAIKFADRLYQAAENGGRGGSLIEIIILQALAEEAQGDRGAALVLLENALTLAEPESYVRIFVDEGPVMVQLLSELTVVGKMSVYARRILAAFEPEKGNHQNENSVPSGAPTVEPLSKRELEVLQLIAQGFSNQEISERLFLAVSSVKGHNQKIFSKLQVQRRTEAVARAHELALL